MKIVIALVAAIVPAAVIVWLLIGVICAIPGVRYSNACGHNAYVWLIITAPLAYVAATIAIYRRIQRPKVSRAE